MELNPFAQITHHEGAIICSYETILDLPLDAVQPKLTELIETVQAHVLNQNGIVGHIKAYAEEQGRSLSFSATGAKVTLLPGCGEVTSVSFTAIVFGIEEKTLQYLVEDYFNKMI